MFSKKYWLVISLCLLVGCQKNISYSYLMQHPDELQQEIIRCQQKSYPYCPEVDKAETDFVNFAKERSENAEVFGEKIMREQSVLVDSFKAYQRATQAEKSAAEMVYRQQLDKVNSLYAVVVATSKVASEKDK